MQNAEACTLGPGLAGVTITSTKLPNHGVFLTLERLLFAFKLRLKSLSGTPQIPEMHKEHASIKVHVLTHAPWSAEY
jgi:hypothetical protein